MNKAEIVSANDAHQFVGCFKEMLRPLSEQDFKRINFVENFAQWLIGKGFKFTGSRNTEQQLLIFSSHLSEQFPIRISLRHESGLHPIAYWINADRTRTNLFFNDLKITNPEEWFGRTFEEYQQRQRK